MPDAFICDALRTPFGRYGGSLSSIRTDDLAAIPIRALLERNPSLDPASIDDVLFGCANQAGEDNRNVARMALLLAGLPETVPGSTINRLCGSSMDAISVASRAIKSGEAGVMIAGGVESMSRAPFVMGKADTPFSRTAEIFDTTIGWRFINPLMKARYGVESMPETAENVAEQFKVFRADQDQLAFRTQQAWARAHLSGFFQREVIPLQIPQKKGDAVTFAIDEHPRPDTTREALARLKPIVKPNGTVTAGNASGINDGAAALLIASEADANQHGLTPRVRIVASAAAGVAPRIMGIGPEPAIRKALKLANLTIDHMDVIELNEAFAAQALAVTRLLKIADDDPRVNPNGGAIAVGHPLGASGARIVGTAMHQLVATGKRYAIASMCIGVGQGIAVVLERV